MRTELRVLEHIREMSFDYKGKRLVGVAALALEQFLQLKETTVVRAIQLLKSLKLIRKDPNPPHLWIVTWRGK